jgi:hypothetical protein
MLGKRREGTWFGGVLRARQYDSLGRYRPEIAAWMLESGLLIAARVTAPGAGAQALGDLLETLLQQGRGPRVHRLAVENPALLGALRGRCSLPLVHEPHWGFAIIVEDNLSHLSGLGFEQGYVERDVTLELARELFASWEAFLQLDLVQSGRPRLCAVSVPGLGRRTIWIGVEPAYLGNGLRVFRDLAAYRTYMHVNVQLDWEWESGDDASLLGLETRELRWLNLKQQRDVEQHALPLRPPAHAPCVVATDRDDVDRPYTAADVRSLTAITRVLCNAFGPRAARSERGALSRAEVWMHHPDATEADLALVA